VKGSERSNSIVGNGNGSSNSGSLGPIRGLTISSDVTCIGVQPLGDNLLVVLDQTIHSAPTPTPIGSGLKIK
jgi:hypothetical protein